MKVKTIFCTSIRFVVFMMLTLPSLSWAGAVLTFHGRIMDNTNQPLEAPSVSFRIRIYSPNPSKCLLYEETRTLNMQNSKGVFVIPIGDGTGSRTGADPGLTMENVFANNGKTISSLSCNSTTSYTPQDLDQRQMAVSFDDNGGYGWDNLPPMDIAYVPFSVHAHDAQNIGGTPAASVLRVSGGNASALTPANFAELLSLINGASSQYEKSGQLRGTNVPSLTNGQVLGWNGGGWTAVTPLTSYTETDPSVKAYAKADLPACGTNSFLKNDGAGNFSCVAVTGANGGTVTSVSAGTGLLNQSSPGNPITATGTLAVDVGTSAGQIVQLDGSGRLPAVNGSLLTNVTASGLSTTASINTSGSIITSGNIQTSQDMTSRRFILFDHSGAGPDSIGLQTPNDMAGSGGASYTLTLPEKKGATGQVLAAKDNNGVLEWVSPSSGSVTSVTASSPLSASAGSTPNITIQQANNSQGGFLSSADWTTFNSKLTSALTIGKIFVGDASNVAAEQTPSGDISMTNAGVFTVTKIQNYAVGSTTPNDGQVLKYVGGGTNQWGPSNFGIGDLKTSMGAQQFASAACTSSQTLTWSALTDAFTCSSIGSLNASTITAGTLDIGRIPTGTSASTVAVGNDVRFPASTCAAGNKMRWDGSAWQCEADSATDTTKVAKTGDTMTGALNLPSNGLAVGTNQLVVNGGSVGVGITAPESPLHIKGNQGATSSLILARTNNVSDRMDLAFKPNGAESAGNLSWLVGVHQNENNFRIGSYDGSSITRRLTITDQGNVGIGTTAPTYKLDVTDGAVRINNTAGTDADLRFGNNASTAGKITYSTQELQFTTAGSQKMVIQSGGNVGIGTTNPAAKLDVAGAVKIGNATTCTATEEGSVRYSSTNKALEFCNGSSWVSAGSGSGSNGLRSCDTGNANDVMVAVGSWCVDKYEASVWSAAAGTGTGYFTDSTTSADTDGNYPTGAANVPAGCNRNGAGCTQYAVSKPGVIPSRGMTWYQAAAFCANAGKQLIPDGLWQTAAIGTNDPGAGSGTGGTAGGSATDAAAAQCNINTHNATWTTWLKTNNGVRPTARAGATSGATNACISQYGVDDMVGNLWEWTDMNGMAAGADQAAFTQGKNNATGGPFANDGTWNINGSAYGCDGAGSSKGTCRWTNNTPAAALRGGNWGNGAQAGVTALVLGNSGSGSHWTFGFRCARPR